MRARWPSETELVEEYAMPDPGQEHLNTTEARAGATPHMTRYVLSIGLILVVLLFAIILLAGG